MKRVSRIEDPEDFTIEIRRERLRKERSDRHRRMILSIAWSIAIVLCGLGATGFKAPILPLVLNWL